jgi:hypothetical protein
MKIVSLCCPGKGVVIHKPRNGSVSIKGLSCISYQKLNLESEFCVGKNVVISNMLQFSETLDLVH